MRIAIINPPHHRQIIREGRCQSPQNMRKTCVPQMTLAYLASTLNGVENELKVYDCIALDLTQNELFHEFDEFYPEIAYINTTTPSINGDVHFVREMKGRYPRCYTVVFGTHVSALHEEIIKTYSFIDCVIRHEPEWVAQKLADYLQNGKSDAVSDLTNCTVRVEDHIVKLPEVELNPELDSLAYPAWQHFPKDRYNHPIFDKPYVMVNTSRGCRHSCIFCVASIYYGKRVRYRSIESVIDELQNHVIGKFGIRYVWMYADDFTNSTEYVKELCKAIIKNNIKITWWSNTRVDKLDEEMFRLMRQAGCYMLSIGGESGNSEILRSIRKGTKLENIKETVKLLRNVGIASLVYFLIGLPGETRETINETIRFAKEINPDYVEFYPATPYPGTKFYEIVAEKQYIVDRNWDKYMCGGDQFVVKIPEIEKDELDIILRKAYRSFYFRPLYILQMIKRMLNPVNFIRLIKFGIGYLQRFV